MLLSALHGTVQFVAEILIQKPECACVTLPWQAHSAGPGGDPTREVHTDSSQEGKPRLHESVEQTTAFLTEKGHRESLYPPSRVSNREPLGALDGVGISSLPPRATTVYALHTPQHPHTTHTRSRVHSHALTHKRALTPYPIYLDGSDSAAVTEAGGLGWMSHRPKVPSILKFLEGVKVSSLFSLEFFNFLFLYQKSQVSQLSKKAVPGPSGYYM